MEPRVSINYDTDVLKHFVRYDGWLDACRFQYEQVQRAMRERKRTAPFSYFTFCASNAIDVFMLEKEGLLLRSPETARLNNVYFCENLESEFEKIVSLIKSGEAGFKGDFKEIILFEDDEITRGKNDIDMRDEVPNKLTRERFRYKQLNRRFYNLFPLDVINLDPYGVFFPPREDRYSAMLRAIEKIFDWQRNRHPDDEHACDSFTLMLTTYIDERGLNAGAIQDIRRIAQNNISTYQAFSEVFENKFGHIDPYSLDASHFPHFFSVILPKLLAEIARRYSWFGHRHRVYLYSRTAPNGSVYYMMSLVIYYERLDRPTRALPLFFEQQPQEIERRYVREMCEIVRTQPIDVNEWMENDKDYTVSVQSDLSNIVEYRNSIASAM